jgi:hypothetical protein
MNELVFKNLMIVLLTGFIIVWRLMKMPKKIRIIVAISIILMLATLMYMLTYHEQTVLNLFNKFNIELNN